MRPRATESPPPLEKHSEGDVAVYLNPAAAGPVGLRDLFNLPEALSGLPGSSTRIPGVPTCWEWHPSWHDGPGLRVRLYAHGGLLGRLWGTVFLGSSRMLDEFRTALHAVREGVPTARPVALRLQRVFGPLTRALYVTEAIPDAVNLLQLCERGQLRGLGTAQRAGLADAVAEAVARMHDAGIVHGDLNLKNVLVRNAFDGPEAFIIDFDRARCTDTVALAERMGNLVRLDRSILKWSASRRAVGILDRMRLVRRYLARYPEWADRWAKIARRYGSGHLRHRLFRQNG